MGTRKKVVSGLLWKFGERITAQIISLVVSIILARLLSPDEYGAVALIMVFITIANVFVANGFGSALIQKKDADNLDFSSVFFINLGISVVLYFIIFFSAPFIADYYELPILAPGLRVIGVRIIVAAINTVQQAYVSRHMLFKRFFWSTLFGTLISGVVGIAMAYKGYGVWALIAQYLTNTCTDTLVLWFTVRWRPQLKVSFTRAKDLISYGWKLLVSALLDTGYNQVRSLIIGKMYTKEDLAFYNQGDKYPGLIVTNINTSISSVLFPALSENQSDKEKVRNMTRRAIQVGSFLMWPMMVGLCVAAGPLIRLLLTEKWLPCVPYLRIFCFTYGLWPIHTANLQAINAMGRSDLFLKLEVVKKLIGIVTLVAALWYGPLAIAWSLVVSGIISTFINAYPNIKLLNYTYREQMQDILPAFLIAVIMGAVIYPISVIGFGDAVTVILQVVAGAIVYFVLSVVTRQEAFRYLMTIIFKRNQGAKDNG